MLGVAMVLRDVAQRLSVIEDKVDRSLDAPRKGRTLIELSKVLFGGWPALGFLFLLLFYWPLREVLYIIPEKVRQANEIAWGKFSLRSTIKREADKLGDDNLSKTIPGLSTAAIELLLQAPKDVDNLISYTPNERQEFIELHFPNSSLLDVMGELQTHGLVEIETSENTIRKITQAEAGKLLDDFRKEHPGREERSYAGDRVTWKLNEPLPRSAKIPVLSWRLTEFGKKAVEVILKAVSAQLAPKPPPANNS